MTETQIKLMEAAEREFAERGFHGASIRDITSRAEANVAAVNYHFGSKEGLFVEMIRHRVTPVNELRIEMLQQALAQKRGGPLGVPELIDIIVRPLIETFLGGHRRASTQYFLQAMGRAMCEESKLVEILHKDILAEVTALFRQELGRALADLPVEVADECFAYLRSTLTGVMQQQKSQPLLEPNITFPDADAMVAFISGGIEAIAVQRRQQPQGDPPPPA